jgi:F-type H+-transporting ATPase subunit epsilon
VQSLGVDQKEEGKKRSAMSGAAAGAAAPYWRNAGMTYISYANTCAAMVRNCLKEPHKTKALNREQVYYKLQTYQEGEPQKPVVRETPPAPPAKKE